MLRLTEVCFCVCMVASLPVRGSTLFTDLVAQVQVAGTNFPGEMVTNEGRFATAPVSESLPASWTSTNGSRANVVGSTTADYGALHGFAAATATPAQADDCRFCFDGSARTLASWEDWFTFTAPAGTNSITVRLTLKLDGTLSAHCASILSECIANARLLLNSGDEAFLPLATFVAAGNGDVTPPPPATAQEIFTFSNGELTWFYSELDLLAGVGPVGGSDAATADFSSTGRLFVDVLTPGGSYTTASGHVYSSIPTSGLPEPSSLGLAGLGAALTIARSVCGKRRPG